MIRRWKPCDAAVCHDIYRSAIMGGHQYTRPQRLAWAKIPYGFRKWRLRQERNFTLVAEMNGRVSGFTEFRPDGHVHMLFVHPAAKGLGIASALLAAGDRILDRQGVVRRSTGASRDSMPVFARAGYRLVGAQNVAAFDQRLLSWRMVRCGR
jgi:putative acetyltransferase